MNADTEANRTYFLNLATSFAKEITPIVNDHHTSPATIEEFAKEATLYGNTASMCGCHNAASGFFKTSATLRYEAAIRRGEV
jgi:hypothetical protein